MIRTRLTELFTSVKFNRSARLLGRWSAGKGYGEEIAIGTGLVLENGVLSATATPPTVAASAPVATTAAVAARATMLLATPSLGDQFSIDGVVFEFAASGGYGPAIVYIGLNELAPEESWATITMAINANVAAVSATFRSDDSELDIIADEAGTSGNSIEVWTIGGISFIDGPNDEVETLVGGVAAIPGTAATHLGQTVIVAETDVYTCVRVSPVKWAKLTP